MRRLGSRERRFLGGIGALGSPERRFLASWARWIAGSQILSELGLLFLFEGRIKIHSIV